MSYPVHIVIKKSASGIYSGGPSRAIGKGRLVASLGKWYGSQKPYKPCQRALSAAEAYAERLNSRTITLRADDSAETQETALRKQLAASGYPQK